MSLSLRMKAAFAAAALAAGAATSAQVPPMRVPDRPDADRPGGSVRPAPPPAREPGAVPQRAVGAGLDERQKGILGTLRQRSQQGQELGRLAQERGASSQVKDLGKKLVEDHARVERELGQLVDERGGRTKDLSGPKDEREAHARTLKQLGRLSGAELDAAFLREVEYAQRGHRADLQRWRDETAGEDARLKRWLSDVELVAESSLLASRNAITALGYRWEEDPRRPDQPSSPERAGRRPPVRAPWGER